MNDQTMNENVVEMTEQSPVMQSEDATPPCEKSNVQPPAGALRHMKPVDESVGMASLICAVVGIIAIYYLSSMCCFFAFPTLILPLGSIVLGIVGICMSRSRGCKNGMAVGGIILSILACLLFVLLAILPWVLSFVMGITAGLLEEAFYPEYYMYEYEYAIPPNGYYSYYI